MLVKLGFFKTLRGKFCIRLCYPRLPCQHLLKLTKCGRLQSVNLYTESAMFSNVIVITVRKRHWVDCFHHVDVCIMRQKCTHFLSVDDLTTATRELQRTKMNQNYLRSTMDKERLKWTCSYHLLRGNASNVVRTGRSVNGNRPKLTLCRSETPSPIKTKLNTIHYVRGTPQRQ
jgi:hypothetical protein